MVPHTHPHPASDRGLVAKVKATGGSALRRHCCLTERIDLVEATAVEAWPRQSAATTERSQAGRANWRGVCEAEQSNAEPIKLGGSTPSRSKAEQIKAEQIKSRSRVAAFPLRTSPLSKGGHGWVGGTICRHGWRHMSLHGRTCSGSRQPTRDRPSQGESSTKAVALSAVAPTAVALRAAALGAVAPITKIQKRRRPKAPSYFHSAAWRE